MPVRLVPAPPRSPLDSRGGPHNRRASQRDGGAQGWRVKKYLQENELMTKHQTAAEYALNISASKELIPTVHAAALMEGNRARVHRRGEAAWGSNGHWRAVGSRRDGNDGDGAPNYGNYFIYHH